MSRRFYLKLDSSFFSRDPGSVFAASPDCNSFFVIYQRLLLDSAANGGKVALDPENPISLHRFADKYNVNDEVLKNALRLMKVSGFIEDTDDGRILLVGWQKHVLSETDAAARMRRYRKQGKASLWKDKASTVAKDELRPEEQVYERPEE